MVNTLKEIEDAGRSTDNVVGHLTVGEIVIPVQLAEIPEVKEIIIAIFQEYGVSLNEFTVGNPENKINPETGYPEFFFGKIFKAIKKAVTAPVKAVQNFVQNPVKAVTNKVKDVGKIITGSGSNSNNNKSSGSSASAPAPAPANNAETDAIKKQMASDKAAFDKYIEDQKKRDEENKKREEEAAKQRAISAESAKASALAAENRTEISDKLSKTLSTPIQQNTQVNPIGYNPSGYGVGEKTKSVPGNSGANVISGGVAAPPTSAAFIAQKINQDNGGTNQQQNKFNIPKTEGLVFGGT